MREGIKIFITSVTMILTLATLIVVILGYMADRNESQKNSDQIENLTDYVKQIIPNKPVINFDFITDEDAKSIEIKKQWLYDCKNTGHNLFGDLPIKKEVDFFVGNSGKSTKNLIITFDCDVSPIEACKEKEITNLNMDEVSLSDIQYEIQEINAQREYKLILFFEENKTPIKCSLSYSSDDIINEVRHFEILEDEE